MFYFYDPVGIGWGHRRRINTEEKAKVVAAAGWGTYLNAALTI